MSRMFQTLLAFIFFVVGIRTTLFFSDNFNAVKHATGAILTVLSLWFLIVPWVRGKSKNVKTFVQVLDEVTLALQSGESLEKIFEMLHQHQKSMTKDQGFRKELRALKWTLQHCEQHPSQAYMIMKAQRDVFRSLSRLQQKQVVITVQGRAQAVTSIFIYFAVFTINWFSNPPFRNFLDTPVGRISTFFSLSLLLVGVWWVFRLSSFKGFSS